MPKKFQLGTKAMPRVKWLEVEQVWLIEANWVFIGGSRGYYPCHWQVKVGRDETCEQWSMRGLPFHLVEGEFSLKNLRTVHQEIYQAVRQILPLS